MKKLTITLCLLLTFCGLIANDFAGGDGSESNPYQITNRQQLENLNNYLGLSNKGVHFRLMNDIDLSGENWTPIGASDNIFDSYKFFRGSLHGGGHKIKNMNIDLPTSTSDYSFAGLFSGLFSGAYIDSLHIDGGSIKCVDRQYSHVGSIAGFIYNTYFSQTTTIHACSNSSKITGGCFIGGIVGTVYTFIKRPSMATVTISKCSNRGVIVGHATSSYPIYIGGVLGAAHNTSYQLDGYRGIVLDECYNTGTIIVEEEDNSERIYIGGIVALGEVNTLSSALLNVLHIKNCYNYGDILTNAFDCCIGGIAGFLVNGLEESKKRNSTTMIENCYAAGNISAGSLHAHIGGVTGAIVSQEGMLTIQNSIATMDSIKAEESSIGRILGLYDNDNLILFNNYANEAMLVNGQTITSTDAASGDGADKPMSELYTQAAYTAMGWDFSGTWAVRSDNRALPYFQWQSVPVVIGGWQSADVTLNLITASERVEVYKNGMAELIGVFNGLQAGNNILQLKGVTEGDVLTFVNYETGKPASYGVRGIAEGTSSITEDGSHPAGINVYPSVLNSGEEVRILSAEPLATTARLYNVSGQLLQTVQLNGTQATLRVEEPQGVYLLVVNGQAVKLVVR
ncbi:hypothetical protein M2132_000847 [Dysgonomonas sp. PH5-45]|uniref:T9SS type A sorting domain-containing protein n=1 Tax=unclassified Dysgonomonas TaxID=2630389 RepID=UPI0024740EBE|nr:MULTISPECIES: T9SS type A sorting domain-containing protein [unclassified Dysgonomonas]MDH6354519.1 hypothetical protein [Dysgonomonas sp. PH5-45]MDH6387425.1 hypothetical protein [Dysgonomonas sp. PH5-37]